MTTIVLEEGVRIPASLDDLDAFRRWACSDAFPERGLFSWLGGELWVDFSRERFRHNQLKGIFAIIVGGLVLAGRLGRFIHDRMLLTIAEVDLATEPDGMFASHEALKSGRVRLTEGDESLEVEGVPDMVLEVVSRSSARKDKVVLRELYWQAGIPEYWLVDARPDAVTFDILRLSKKGYLTTRKQDGWMKSAVFGKSFRLMQDTEASGVTDFRLEVP
jgi:Uma2 family endonuclease